MDLFAVLFQDAEEHHLRADDGRVCSVCRCMPWRPVRLPELLRKKHNLLPYYMDTGFISVEPSCTRGASSIP